MSRRRKAEKRKIPPDPIYNNANIAKFINCLMKKGKKSLAQKIVYQALELFAKKVKIDNPMKAFEQALENAKPSLQVKSRRIGGATYQVPMEVPPNKKLYLATRWIIQNAKSKKGKSMLDGLILELTDCYNNQGATIKKKEELHKMAEANKAFAHYK
ncbi:MAG: 30S ribosomal protein S7 [Chlamydiae bacterium SM23_39]|nr:MAG: 30S ribosomal protein S7 [Chlamydiae bacterium SM23_39]